MPQTAESIERTLYDLVQKVGDRRVGTEEAKRRLRLAVDALDLAERETWRKSAPESARRLAQIAEVFQQELTVIGAGQ